jgi:hypothetical protein
MVYRLTVYWPVIYRFNGLPANSLPADQNLIQDILSLPANSLLASDLPANL